jgi:hypothetical protein
MTMGRSFKIPGNTGDPHVFYHAMFMHLNHALAEEGGVPPTLKEVYQGDYLATLSSQPLSANDLLTIRLRERLGLSAHEGIGLLYQEVAEHLTGHADEPSSQFARQLRKIIKHAGFAHDPDGFVAHVQAQNQPKRPPFPPVRIEVSSAPEQEGHAKLTVEADGSWVQRTIQKKHRLSSNQDLDDGVLNRLQRTAPLDWEKQFDAAGWNPLDAQPEQERSQQTITRYGLEVTLHSTLRSAHPQTQIAIHNNRTDKDVRMFLPISAKQARALVVQALEGLQEQVLDRLLEGRARINLEIELRNGVEAAHQAMKRTNKENARGR